MADKHLPGQHDQSSHGHGGYTPGMQEHTPLRSVPASEVSSQIEGVPGPRSQKAQVLVDQAMGRLRSLGVDLPAGTRFVAGRWDPETEVVAYQPDTGFIRINEKASFWDDPAGGQAELHRKGMASTDLPDHLILHELAHAVHHQAVGGNYAVTGPMDKKYEQQIRREVSHRAANIDPREFVAEVFVGHLAGKTYTPKLEKMYDALKGPRRKEGQKSYQGTKAKSLIDQVFDPSEWHDELVDAVLPVLAVGMAKAMVSQLLVLGVDVRKKGRVRRKSTATDWLEGNQEAMDRLIEMAEAAGVPGWSVLTELPESMKANIVEQLKTSFEQDYWDNIAETTAGNANTILEEGLREGESIATMARKLKERLGNDSYARTRAFNIARTESGNALNGGRRAVMDQLMEDLGDKVKMTPTWLSVLGTTTRPTHANLDGVPADKDGMWRLSGYKIPWPGHFSLPAEERCQCQCSISMEFGMQDDEARQLIADHYAREEEWDEAQFMDWARKQPGLIEYWNRKHDEHYAAQFVGENE